MGVADGTVLLDSLALLVKEDRTASPAGKAHRAGPGRAASWGRRGPTVPRGLRDILGLQAGLALQGRCVATHPGRV